MPRCLSVDSTREGQSQRGCPDVCLLIDRLVLAGVELEAGCGLGSVGLVWSGRCVFVSGRFVGRVLGAGGR